MLLEWYWRFFPQKYCEFITPNLCLKFSNCGPDTSWYWNVNHNNSRPRVHTVALCLRRCHFALGCFVSLLVFFCLSLSRCYWLLQSPTGIIKFNLICSLHWTDNGWLKKHTCRLGEMFLLDTWYLWLCFCGWTEQKHQNNRGLSSVRLHARYNFDYTLIKAM